jgi:ABC-type Fe3+/spermidine/putrescine transport system ATPase subunit
VTHDQEEAMTMSDRIAVMNRGHYEQLGNPEELYERPATRFVADFIGTTNLLHGLVADDGTVRLTSGEPAPCVHAGLAPGSEVDLSVRPESIRLVEGDGAGLRGKVELAAYLGTTVSYQVRTGGGLALTVLAPKNDARLTPGTDVVVTWPAAEALVLAAPG